VPGQMGMINLGEMMSKALRGNQLKRRKLSVPAAWDKLVEEEADKRLDQDELSRSALADAEANGIVFLDEIDKIAVSDVRGGSVSREGVQRDLLPLIEGTTVATKYGPMKTDHILFIASGAFHVAKPSDLLPELQGRLPIRVELKALTEADFVAILSDTKASLPAQYKALLATEGVTVEITEDGIAAIARIAAEVNAEIENIGARRLQTVMEKLLESVSYEAEDRRGETVLVDCRTGATVTSSMITQTGKYYRLTVSGSGLLYSGNPTTNGDAFYLSVGGWGSPSAYNTPTGLQINGANPTTPAYRADHVYQLTLAGTGAAFTFRFYDPEYNDNSNWALTVVLCQLD